MEVDEEGPDGVLVGVGNMRPEPVLPFHDVTPFHLGLLAAGGGQPVAQQLLHSLCLHSCHACSAHAPSGQAVQQHGEDCNMTGDSSRPLPALVSCKLSRRVAKLYLLQCIAELHKATCQCGSEMDSTKQSCTAQGIASPACKHTGMMHALCATVAKARRRRQLPDREHRVSKHVCHGNDLVWYIVHVHCQELCRCRQEDSHAIED